MYPPPQPGDVVGFPPEIEAAGGVAAVTRGSVVSGVEREDVGPEMVEA